MRCPKCDFDQPIEDALISKRSGSGTHKGERAYWYRVELQCIHCDHYWVDEDCSI